MFMLEKGIDIPTAEIDIMAGENRQAPYTDVNPAGQMPSLTLDDGTNIAETIVICECLEEAHPAPALIGSTPSERAQTRMWTRRIEFKINNPLTDAFRYAEGLPMFKDRIRTIPEAADGLKALAREGLEWLDGQLAGRDFVVGDSLTLADITLYAFLDFAPGVGQPIDPILKNVAGLLERVASRPSAEESIHPAAKASGMRA
jgi:glutathione S-transferase